MIARFEIGEVLLATSIGDVLRQIRVAVMPCNPSLFRDLAKSHSIHLREFGRLAERERSLSVERDGKFGPEALRNFRFGNAEVLAEPSPGYSRSSPCLTIPPSTVERHRSHRWTPMVMNGASVGHRHSCLAGRTRTFQL